MSSGSMPAVRMARSEATAAIDAVVSLRRGDAPLADAGPRHDPLVGRVDHPLEVARWSAPGRARSDPSR